MDGRRGRERRRGRGEGGCFDGGRGDMTYEWLGGVMALSLGKGNNLRWRVANGAGIPK